MSADKLNIFNFSDKKTVTLHLSWVAFFITFFMWFSHSSLMPLIQATFGLERREESP